MPGISAKCGSSVSVRQSVYVRRSMVVFLVLRLTVLSVPSSEQSIKKRDMDWVRRQLGDGDDLDDGVGVVREQRRPTSASNTETQKAKVGEERLLKKQRNVWSSLNLQNIKSRLELFTVGSKYWNPLDSKSEENGIPDNLGLALMEYALGIPKDPYDPTRHDEEPLSERILPHLESAYELDRMRRALATLDERDERSLVSLTESNIWFSEKVLLQAAYIMYVKTSEHNVRASQTWLEVFHEVRGNIFKTVTNGRGASGSNQVDCWSVFGEMSINTDPMPFSLEDEIRIVKRYISIVKKMLQRKIREQAIGRFLCFGNGMTFAYYSYGGHGDDRYRATEGGGTIDGVRHFHEQTGIPMNTDPVLHLLRLWTQFQTKVFPLLEFTNPDFSERGYWKRWAKGLLGGDYDLVVNRGGNGDDVCLGKRIKDDQDDGISDICYRDDAIPSKLSSRYRQLRDVHSPIVRAFDDSPYPFKRRLRVGFFSKRISDAGSSIFGSFGPTILSLHNSEISIEIVIFYGDTRHQDADSNVVVNDESNPIPFKTPFQRMGATQPNDYGRKITEIFLDSSIELSDEVSSEEGSHFKWKLDQIRQKIIEANLDILIYLDLWMDPTNHALVLSKLAPIQVNTHGHPVTSASPAIDFYLSWEASEVYEWEEGRRPSVMKKKGEDEADSHQNRRLARAKSHPAQAHYIEELILLPRTSPLTFFVPRNIGTRSVMTNEEWGHMDREYLVRKFILNKVKFPVSTEGGSNSELNSNRDEGDKQRSNSAGDTEKHHESLVQTLMKMNWYFLPQLQFKMSWFFDKILKDILDRDPNGIILMVENMKHMGALQRLYEERLRFYGVILSKSANTTETEITADNLKKSGINRIIFLARLDGHHVMGFHVNSNVVLDSVWFGGDTTTREAFEVGAPVITLPFRYLGGRWSQGFYRVLLGNETNVDQDVDERAIIEGSPMKRETKLLEEKTFLWSHVVAKNASHYVQLAVNIGKNRTLEKQVRFQVRERAKERLYHQGESVKNWFKGLEKMVWRKLLSMGDEQ